MNRRPVASFEELHSKMKICMPVLMLLGRLEFYALLIALTAMAALFTAPVAAKVL